MLKHQRTKIIRLCPDNFTFNMWGGYWIPAFKGLSRSRRPVGESWEFSGHPAHPSRVLSKKGDIPLPRLVRRHPALWGGVRIPFLLKFIDARDDLSIQVHPTDSYARRVDRDSGKAESWVILGTASGSDNGFIYLGFRPGVQGGKRAFRRVLEKVQQLGPTSSAQKRLAAARHILPYLNKVRVRPGEVYDLPPGTIHAIGRGVRLFEIQQTSDLTYRIWDWNRPNRNLRGSCLVSRPLHLKKAFDVLTFSPKPSVYFRVVPKLLKRSRFASEERLIHRPRAKYAAHRIRILKKGAFIDQSGSERFDVLTVVEGRVEVKGSGDSLILETGWTAIVPKGFGRYHLTGLSARASVIKSFSPSA